MAWSSAARGLKELDRVARGVFEQDLAAAAPRDDVATEAAPASRSDVDLALEVCDLDLDAVPAPGPGRRPSGVGWPAPPAPARLSSNRKSPRVSVAKPGPGRISTSKPSRSA